MHTFHGALPVRHDSPKRSPMLPQNIKLSVPATLAAPFDGELAASYETAIARATPFSIAAAGPNVSPAVLHALVVENTR